ncbi:MAG: hypothetical protein Q4E91_01560 [Lachnospiraceae bacterium]|nr:hypothetical protein [Lachnospiraceae bacterium]
MNLFETYFRELENGDIEQCYRYRGEELAKKSDVYEWYIKARAYTDTFSTRSKIALGISIFSMAVSVTTTVLCIFT